jgi:hypothetical protein
MATLIKNSGTAVECEPGNNQPVQQESVPYADLDPINAQIDAFRKKIAESTDEQIKGMIYTATAFRVPDVQALLAAHPDCAYLRVFNAFDGGEHTTYMVALNSNFESLTSDGAVVMQSCCPCKPCKI